MKLLTFIFLAAFTLLGFSSQIQMKACPGEGPQPLILNDVSAELQKPQLIPTNESIRDFVVAEGNRSIYYRNKFSVVNQMDLETHKNTVLTKSNLPLSKAVDFRGRYLMTEKVNFLFDVFNAQAGWKYFGIPLEGSITPLYWKHFFNKDVLFEIVNWRDRMTGRQRITIYSYTQGDWKMNHCDLKDVSGTLMLGEGHYYPNVFLYDTVSKGENSSLRLWNIKIDGPIFTCKAQLAYKYAHTIPGQVRSVSQFAGSRMFAVKTTDKERNLIWTNKEDNKGCRYLNFGERDSFVINKYQPVIAAWGKYDGLTLVYPNEQKRASVLLGSENFQVKKEHLWMSNKGDQLISAVPTYNDSESYDLYETSLNP